MASKKLMYIDPDLIPDELKEEMSREAIHRINSAHKYLKLGPYVTSSYDSEADVLYISIGEPVPAISDEVCPGVLVRRDPSSGQIVGMTLLDFLGSEDD